MDSNSLWPMAVALFVLATVISRLTIRTQHKIIAGLRQTIQEQEEAIQMRTDEIARLYARFGVDFA